MSMCDKLHPQLHPPDVAFHLYLTGTFHYYSLVPSRPHPWWRTSQRRGQVGLKTGTGNEEMRNEETGKWKNEEMETYLCAEPWIIYWQKLTGKASRLVLSLVVWPARLLSWLTVGISNYLLECDIGWQAKKGHKTTGERYGWEFQWWWDHHRVHGHQQY